MSVSSPASAVVVAQPATPDPLTRVEIGSGPAIMSAQPYAVLQQRVIELPQTTRGLVELAKAESLKHAGVQVAPPPGNLPALTLPVQVDMPALPPLRALPIPHELLGA
jgi:hypothetical protein